jgi:hypothetical protein
MVGWCGHVDACLGLEGLAERNRDPTANVPGGGGDHSGCEVVQSPSLPVVFPATPVGDGVEELAELVRGHV